MKKLKPRKQKALMKKAIKCLDGKDWGGMAMLGKRIGVSRAYVSALISGKRQVSPNVALEIERVTKGEVTLNDFFKEIRSA